MEESQGGEHKTTSFLLAAQTSHHAYHCHFGAILCYFCAMGVGWDGEKILFSIALKYFYNLRKKTIEF